MRVLIYGGNGFIGRHLAERLRRDAKIFVFDRRQASSVNFLGDVKDAEAVTEAMLQCDRWVNLAGLLGTSELIDRAQDAVDVNITSALNVYNAALAQGKPGLQITVGNHWMNNPYSITKSTAERLALMYNRELGTDIRVVRAMNVFGPGQKARPVRKLIPNVILPALRDEEIVIYGDGSQIMDMIYATDAAEILARILLGPQPQVDEILEAGAGPITVNEIVLMVLGIVGKGKVTHRPMRPGEEAKAIVEISRKGAARLNQLIDFNVYRDCTPLYDALVQTVAWYQTHGS